MTEYIQERIAISGGKNSRVPLTVGMIVFIFSTCFKAYGNYKSSNHQISADIDSIHGNTCDEILQSG